MLRSTLAWESCQLCRRHGPVFDCKVGYSSMRVCMNCAVTLGAVCKGIELESVTKRRTAADTRTKEARRSASPDISVLRSLKESI